MNFKNRMYTMYDNPLDEGASKLYLSNGYDNMTSQEVKDENSIIEDLEKWNHKFLTFGVLIIIFLTIQILPYCRYQILFHIPRRCI